MSQIGPPQGHRRGDSGYLRALLALFAYGLATFAMIYVVQPNYVLIGRDLGRSASETSLLLSAATLALALVVVPVARLSARWGRARTMAVGLVLASVGGLGVAWADQFEVMLALRAFQGVGFAGATGCALAWVAEEIHHADVPRVGGLYIAGTTLGGMMGRLLGGAVAELGGWRWSVVVVTLVCAALTVFAMVTLPRSTADPARPRAGGVGARRRNTNAGADAGGRNPAGPASDDDGRGTRLERLDRANSANRLRLYLVAGAGMAAFVGVFTAIVFRAAAPPYLMGPGVTSLFFLTYLAGTFTSSQAGWVVSRLGVRRTSLIGLAQCFAGVLLTLATPAWAIWCGLLVMSAGFFLTHAVASSTAPRLTSRPSAASGRYTLSYYVGSSLGGVLIGAAWDLGGWVPCVIAAVLAFAVAAVAAAGLRPAGDARLD